MSPKIAAEAKTLLKTYLKKIVNDEIPPLEGMRAIDNDIYASVWSEGCEKHVGEILGLEHMYTWYRELQDAADGDPLSYYTNIPREEAVKKFTAHLKEEAKKVLITIEKN